MKKVGFGVLWFIVLSIGLLVLGGMIAGGLAGAKYPEQSAAVGELAGKEFGKQYGSLIFVISLLVAGGGAFLELLPGTKPKQF